MSYSMMTLRILTTKNKDDYNRILYKKDRP